MWTRRKAAAVKREKEKASVEQECVDVTIQKPASFYRKKWRKSRKAYKRVKKQKLSLERSVYANIRKEIERKIRSYHCFSDVEVVIVNVPRYLWRKLMKGWEEYTPTKRKQHFTGYRKTHKAATFQKSFKGVKMVKKVSTHLDMKITIGQRAPARVIYNEEENIMIISFWYEPFPFPLGWLPTYRGSENPKGKCKHKTYFVEK